MRMLGNVDEDDLSFLSDSNALKYIRSIQNFIKCSDKQ